MSNLHPTSLWKWTQIRKSLQHVPLFYRKQSEKGCVLSPGKTDNYHCTQSLLHRILVQHASLHLYINDISIIYTDTICGMSYSTRAICIHHIPRESGTHIYALPILALPELYKLHGNPAVHTQVHLRLVIPKHHKL